MAVSTSRRCCPARLQPSSRRSGPAPQASCDETSPNGGLDVIATLTEGTCTHRRRHDAAAGHPGGGRRAADPAGPADRRRRASRSTSARPPRPRSPSRVRPSIADRLPDPALAEGDHRLCLTVFASDAGGPGSIESCSPVGSGGGPADLRGLSPAPSRPDSRRDRRSQDHRPSLPCTKPLDGECLALYDGALWSRSGAKWGAVVNDRRSWTERRF